MASNDESSKPFQSLRLNVKNIEKSSLPKDGSDAATTLAGQPLTTRSDDNTPEESESIFRTNMVMSQNGGLIMCTQTSSAFNYGNINVWDDAARDLWIHTKAAEKFKVTTKDFDFSRANTTKKTESGPSRRKKIYKVYVTFKCKSYMSGIKVNYATNGSTSFTGNFSNTTYYSGATGFDSYNAGSPSNDWITVGLKPTSSINNIYSFALQFSHANAGHIGKVVAVPSTSSIQLKSGSSAVDDYYNGMPIFFYSGSGYGQIRKIIDYNGTTKVATLSSALNTAVDTETLYDLGYIHSSFEINDISIIYREKSVK
jgi:hypothetical protein